MNLANKMYMKAKGKKYKSSTNNYSLKGSATTSRKNLTYKSDLKGKISKANKEISQVTAITGKFTTSGVDK